MQIMEMARGCNQSFEELPSIDQQLTFSKLSIELIRVLGIEQLNRDILKTLELYSDQNGFNNAAALLADTNSFKGIDIIRFGNSINEIMERKSLENISILLQMEQCIQMFHQYYRYEKIEGMDRKSVDKIPERDFREAVANALGADGRILVRESGTEPVVRVMVEAGSTEECEKYVDQVIDVIKSKGYAV